MENLQADILFYNSPAGNVRVEVIFNDEIFWLNQKRLAELFGVEVNTINYHLKEIYKSGELEEQATIRKIRIVQKEGNRHVDAGKVSHEVAMRLAEEQFEKFRVEQDKNFESDFDRELKKWKLT